jgi:sulfhydrogenase subunit gamma (sulfur reductase)
MVTVTATGMAMPRETVKVSHNIYKPYLMTIVDMRDETHDTRTLRLQFKDPEVAQTFDWKPGQFAQYSVFGVGECVFTIANSPTRKGYIECTFRQVGKVTSALRDMEIGQTIGFRGPYGNWFPVEEWEGKRLYFVGGGIGTVALRGVMQYCLDNRKLYDEILILNAARTVADLVYKSEMDEWAKVDGVTLVKAVDPGGETPDWDGKVGLAPNVFEELKPTPDNAILVTCGPPIMIRFMLLAAERLGFKPEQVYTTLENRMKCGLGKCGRCNVGPYYVCKDGPVFTAAQLAKLPKDF